MFKTAKIKSKYVVAALLVFGALGFFALNSIKKADAQIVAINPGGNPVPGAGVPLEVGDVFGWAWMGQNIETQDESEGGGGWLNLNCKPSHCGTSATTDDWGTSINLVHDANFGLFSGQGWSSHYGWFSFEYDDVETCWADNPFVVTQTPATALLMDAGPWVSVVGWGRFVGGGDIADDGWDGCVSFNGLNHSVEINKETGVIRGWGWGGPVTGWVSFTNPECPDCNTGAVLEGITSLSFWADDTSVVLGGGTTLRWQATNQAPNFVTQCEDYSNTSNYSHWKSTGIGSTLNVGNISTAAGNLPLGEHDISGIMQSTTYELNCEDRYGVSLPPQYVTININGAGVCTDPTANNVGDPLPCVFDTLGCTNPLAANWDPLATIDDGTCVFNGGPTITLNTITNNNPSDSVPYNPTGPLNPFDPTDGPPYQVGLQWTITNKSQVVPGSCYGTMHDPDNNLQVPPGGWGSSVLPGPTGLGSTYSNTSATNLAAFATLPAVNPGDQFTFRISCLTSGGGTISAIDTVVVLGNAGIAGCTDSTFANYNPLATIDDGSCSNNPPPPPPGRPRLNLIATPGTLTVGSGNYLVDLSYATNPANQMDSCRGAAVFIAQSSSIINLSSYGWDSVPPPLPDPNNSINNVNLATWASTASDGDRFVFTITCDDNGTTRTDQATVIMNDPIVSTEPPVVELFILEPDIDPQGNLVRENISPVFGDDLVTLKWSALNVSACVGTSTMYTGAVNNGPNPAWNNISLADDDSLNNTEDLNITDPAVIKNTLFRITCTPEDGSANRTATVCLGLTNTDFAQCNVTSPGSVPSYEEI